MIAADVMTENPRTIRPTDPVSMALDALQSTQIRHLPVVDEDNNLVGMLSDRDLGPLMGTFTDGAAAQSMIVPLSQRRVAEFMSSDVVSVDEDADVREIIDALLDNRIGAIPVIDGEGTVLGIVSSVDVLRALEAELEPSATSPVQTVHRATPEVTLHAPSRLRSASVSGQDWAEQKAAALEGTSPRDWPDEWDDAWNGELSLARSQELSPAALAELRARASDAARARWAEILEDQRAGDDGEEQGEARAVELYEALRGHVPAGLSVGREGARVYLQDVSDADETTVASMAEAARAISDWQDRHLGH